MTALISISKRRAKAPSAPSSRDQVRFASLVSVTQDHREHDYSYRQDVITARELSPALYGFRRRWLAFCLIAFLSSSVGAQPLAPVAGVDLYLSRLEPVGFSGAVLVSQNHSVLLAKGFGLADRERRIPFSRRTLFDVGSLTKQFTAAAIMRLVADNRLEVSDSLGRFFSNVPADKRSITLYHLLTHTSGLVMGLGGDYQRMSRDSLLVKAFASTLLSSPGTQHAYSNVGFGVLAAVVEAASGMKYEEYLKSKLFEPAGMKETGYTFQKQQRPRLAVGYRDGKAWGLGAARTDSLSGDYWNLIGNGGIHSSLDDLQRWASALRRGSILPAARVREMMSPHVLVSPRYLEDGATLHYGYGWYVWKRPSGPIVFHDGGNGISYASMRFHVVSGMFIGYGANVSEFANTGPFPALTWILDRRPVEMPPVAKSFGPGASRFDGIYADTSATNSLHVHAMGNRLQIFGAGQAAHSFAAFNGWRSNPVLDSLNNKLRAFMDLSYEGSWQGLGQFIQPPTTVDQIQGVETEFWKKRTASLGKYIGTTVLGTRPSRSRLFPATTYVASDFERGPAYREFVWNEARKLVDYGPISSPPVTAFFSETPRCAVAFDHSRARTARICFDQRNTMPTAIVDSPESGRQTLRRKN